MAAGGSVYHGVATFRGGCMRCDDCIIDGERIGSDEHGLRNEGSSS